LIPGLGKRPSIDDAPDEKPPMDFTLTPGRFVRHPQCPDWGLGQIQSAVGSRITANFEHAGKVVIDATVVTLVAVESDDDENASRG
jgi:hypothetical protein